jgi:hypothetical protein
VTHALKVDVIKGYQWSAYNLMTIKMIEDWEREAMVVAKVQALVQRLSECG